MAVKCFHELVKDFIPGFKTVVYSGDYNDFCGGVVGIIRPNEGIGNFVDVKGVYGAAVRRGSHSLYSIETVYGTSDHVQPVCV